MDEQIYKPENSQCGIRGSISVCFIDKHHFVVRIRKPCAKKLLIEAKYLCAHDKFKCADVDS